MYTIAERVTYDYSTALIPRDLRSTTVPNYRLFLVVQVFLVTTIYSQSSFKHNYIIALTGSFIFRMFILLACIGACPKGYRMWLRKETRVEV